MRRFLISLSHIVSMIFFLILSIFFFSLVLFPGSVSNLFAWLESDGSCIALLLSGVSFIGFCIRLCVYKNFKKNQTIIVHKGIFTTKINKKVFEGTIKRLWNDYFGETQLPVEITLKRYSLYITGSAPKENVDTDELTTFFHQKLLRLTGFFGPIYIQIKKQR